MRRNALAALLLTAATTVRAALLVYDGMPVTGTNPYQVGVNLGGQNPAHPTIVGKSGPWINSTSGVRPAAGGLSYPAAIGLTAQPGMARLLQAGTTGIGVRTSYRLLSAPLAQSFYLSVLAAYTSLPHYTNGHYGVMGLSNATTGSGFVPHEGNAVYVGFIKRDGDVVDAILKLNADVHVIQANIAPGTHMFVVKFTHNPAGNETVAAAIVTTPAAPVTWPLTVSNVNVIDGATTLRHVAIGGFWQTWNGIDFDEWRIGTTYADVVGLSGGGPSFAGLAGVHSVSTTNATLTARLDSAGSPPATLWAFWGESDGGQNAGAWTGRAAYGTATGDGQNLSFSAFSPALLENRFYYYRMAASNETGMAWALSNPSYFMTAPVTVTAPASVPENSLTPVAFTLARPAAVTALPLAVPYTISGTAVPGVHIVSNYTGIAQFTVGATNAVVAIQPLPDWASITARTVVLTLQPGPYVTSAPNSAAVTLTDAPLPAAPTNAWMGSISTLASAPGNWSLGVVPTADHDVLVTPAFAQRNLAWDTAAPALVRSWTQPVGSTNTVTFSTTLAAPLTVAQDVVLMQGTWTHAGPSNAPTAAVAVVIGGNLNVATGASINVNARGWAVTTGPGYFGASGASHAGEGWMGNVTYGSVLNPLSYGSGSLGSGANPWAYGGGGLVHLTVTGMATINGTVSANGYGFPNNRGASAGGAINLSAGQLVGSGALTANGGGDTYVGSGSGGRIRLRLTTPGATFAGFTGIARAEGANGGSIPPAHDTGASASGTVLWQTAADPATGGQLVFDNVGAARDATNGVVRATHLTPTSGPADDLRGCDAILRGNARLRLTADARLRSLTIVRSLPVITPRFYLDGYTLRVDALTVLGTVYTSGAYMSENIAGGVVLGVGQILVGQAPLLLLVR